MVLAFYTENFVTKLSVLVKTLKSQYYIEQVEHLKSDKPNNSWKLIKQLTGVVTTRKQEECFLNLLIILELIPMISLKQSIHFSSQLQLILCLSISTFLMILRDTLEIVP
jgi:hypothetical protein